jgi:hypothetical protein
VGDHLKIGKSRKPGGNVFGQAVGQSFEVGIANCPLERQHRDPEARIFSNCGATRGRVGCQDFRFTLLASR